MGSLKPGVTLIHERVGNVVYSREFGADPMTRKVAGWDYNKDDPKFDPRISATADLADHNEWIKIRLAGKTNPTLQTAIDRVKLLYKLSIEKYE
jgi:hypothetical protein